MTIFLLAIVLALASVKPVSGYASGAQSCVFPDSSQMSPGKSTTGGYSIQFSDYTTKDNITAFARGQRVIVTLEGSIGYKGFLVVAVRSSTNTIFEDIYGSYTARGLQQELSCAAANSGAITHTMDRSSMAATKDTFYWTAPADASESVQFYAVVVVAKSTWYGQANAITAPLVLNATAPVVSYSEAIPGNSNLPMATNTPKNTGDKLLFYDVLILALTAIFMLIWQ